MAYINGRKTFDVIRTVELSPVLLFNIVYSTSEPSDITKIWVKTNATPSKLLLQQYVETTDTLNQLSALNPIGTAYMGFGTVGNYIYLFGGNYTYSGSSAYTSNSIMRFDSTSETSTTLATTLPISATGITAVVVGTDIYLFGGYNYDGSSPMYLNTILKFDTTDNTITTLSATLPTAVRDMGFGVVGNYIYLFGGQNASTDYSTILKFNTTTGTISTLATTLPSGANHCAMACATVGTDIYLINGVAGSSHYQNAVKFDTINETATLISNVGGNQKYARAGVIEDKIYIFCGYTTSGNGNRYIQVFDTTTETTTTLSVQFSTSLRPYGVGIGTIGNKIYLLNGATSTGIIKAVFKFVSSALVVPRNNLLMMTNYSGEVLWIIDTEQIHISLPVYDAYIGNSNNVGEQVKVAFYQEGVGWVEVN